MNSSETVHADSTCVNSLICFCWSKLHVVRNGFLGSFAQKRNDVGSIFSAHSGHLNTLDGDGMLYPTLY